MFGSELTCNVEMHFCDMKEVTLSPQEKKNSRFRKIVTLPELLFSEMTKNPSHQLTTTPKLFWELSLPY